MHQEQHTHEPDVHLHPRRPDVDPEQRDAGILLPLSCENFPSAMIHLHGGIV